LHISKKFQKGNQIMVQLIPQDKAEREYIQLLVRQYQEQHHLIPPLLLESLAQHSQNIIALHGVSPGYEHFTMVLLNNMLWHEMMRKIPYDRRVLLLPQCLRNKATCPAKMDEIGLLCEQCGQCLLGDITNQAEKLGYCTIIAEGTTAVAALLEQGKIDAVIGVGCLAVLEKAFSHWVQHGIPGIAIPLFQAGCDQTKVDWDWVWNAVYLSYEPTTKRSFAELKLMPNTWLDKSQASVLADAHSITSQLAYDWLTQQGKRWRPFLTVAAYQSLCSAWNEPMIRKLALAVECFHKASLIHDDIEDDDATRYGLPTMHQKYGIPIALNLGDFLIGEGYRHISQCGAKPEQVVSMIQVASLGQQHLCIGQGQELQWRDSKQTPSAHEMLEMFCYKTAPAFYVALTLGALAACAEPDLLEILQKFSQSLGIAYQISDDIVDSQDVEPTPEHPNLNRILILDILKEEKLQKQSSLTIPIATTVAFQTSDAQTQAKQLLEYYKTRSLSLLQDVRSIELKILLYQTVHRVLQ